MDLMFLLPLLGGAFGAAIVNSVFAFFKHGRDAALEQEQWRRNQRQAGYANYLGALQEFKSAMARTQCGMLEGEESAKAISDTQEAFFLANGGLHMLAPGPLIGASSEIKSGTDDVMRALLEHLKEATVETENEWDDASRRLSRATTNFIVMARHDVGMHEDNLGKTRAALQNELLEVRNSSPLPSRSGAVES